MSQGLYGLPQYKSVQTGEVSGSTTAKQLPDIPAAVIKIKAVIGNAGNVYLGASGVTKVDTTTDVTTGIELDAGEETGWIAIQNLNILYIICDNVGDDITYMVLL